MSTSPIRRAPELDLPSWQAQGFLVCPGFVEERDLAVARAQAQMLVHALAPAAAPAVFSSRDPARCADAALLASAHAVHAFFEEDAVDAHGALCVPPERAINKIGHALHTLDPVFAPFTRRPGLAALAATLGLAQTRWMQSQLIFKQPGIGGEVRWHQDASYFLTTPQSVTTFWFALEDATLDNGCLWVLPGGHCGPLREVVVRDGARLRQQTLDPMPWPAQRDALPLAVPAGTLICLHGHLPHCSDANRSPRSRLAYVLHAVDGTAAYSAGNWLQPLAEDPPAANL